MSEEFKFSDVKPETILDWYLPENDPVSGRVVVGSNFVEIKELIHFEVFVEKLYDEVEKRGDETDFNLKLDWVVDGVKKRIKYRAHKQESIDGKYVILRQMPVVLPELSDLGLPDAIKIILEHENLKQGGLILICGEPGNGKSTTTAAMIKRRLQKHGGFCLTLENPVEMPLQGRHGNGFCLQSPVDEGGFEKALSAAMRCYPTATSAMLYLGEIRSAETAAEALRIANNGHLVVTTLHSSGVITSIKRVLSLAKSNKMTEEEACSLMGSSLRLIIHQKLEYSAEKSEERKLKVSFIFSGSNTSSVANRVRNGGVDNLVTEVEQQNQLLKSSNTSQLNKLLEGWSKDIK